MTVSFDEAAREGLADERMRAALLHATDTIRSRREARVGEVPGWEALRDAGAEARDRALHRLDEVLELLEERVTRAGGVVHWAGDRAEANATVVGLVAATGAREVVKVKSLLTDELGLNGALSEAGITPLETDLAELIIQLAGDRGSHPLVPALHRDRREIGDLFRGWGLGGPDLPDEPAALAAAARVHLREAFLRAEVAISGANFAVAETGTICVVESEGNGRICTTLPRTLVTVMGIEKVVERFADLGPLLQLLARSATGERMNPYTSLWTGVRPGDGPEAFHLVIVDAGRSAALADPVARPVLRCIRCAACVNVCPVYRRAGGHAYRTVYAGPIGAILQPWLDGPGGASAHLPFASTLCGACADVCPVRIDIPRLLVHGRARAVESDGGGSTGRALRILGHVLASERALGHAQRFGRLLQRPLVRGERFRRFPGPLAGWGRSRELPGVARETFREWWAKR